MDNVQLPKLHFAHSAMFNECIAEACMSTLYERVSRAKSCIGGRRKQFNDREFLPPSIEHVVGTVTHRTASSSAALRRI
jgi:hypothetical protein